MLRPIVFGANDGLVSNLALVMGVAGANAAPAVIVLAGIAGLLAGAFSMGVGEYISVQSQRELLDFQLAFQRHQLRGAPEQEHRILRDIYVGRGLDPDEATPVRRSVVRTAGAGRPASSSSRRSVSTSGPSAVRIRPGSARSSRSRLAPSFRWSRTWWPEKGFAFYSSLGASFLALLALGVGISRLTHRSALYSAVRQLVLGAVAAGVTYAVGTLLGATL